MVMMQADQDFTGPRGKVKQGDVVDVAPKVAARWVANGLAHPYTDGDSQNLTLQTQRAVIDEQPNVTADSEPVVAGNLEAKEAADAATVDAAKESAALAEDTAPKGKKA